MSEPEEQLPPPIPVREEVLPYFTMASLGDWVAVAHYETIGQWHAAKGVLTRNGIAARMGTGMPEGNTPLLVAATELEWARELLHLSGRPAQPILAKSIPSEVRGTIPVNCFSPRERSGGFWAVYILSILLLILLVIAVVAEILTY